MAAGGALFSLRCGGSTRWYAAMLRSGGRIAFDLSESFDKKNKLLNRMDIVGTNGLQMLSVPLAKPHRQLTVGEVELSEHANWRHNHWGALFSAYGRTPYFDYIADDLHRLYFDMSLRTIAAFDVALHRLVADFLDLPIKEVPAEECTEDWRDSVAGERISALPVKSYEQIWENKNGFQPGLSILDLLFNLGREAIFVLR